MCMKIPPEYVLVVCYIVLFKVHKAQSQPAAIAVDTGREENVAVLCSGDHIQATGRLLQVSFLYLCCCYIMLIIFPYKMGMHWQNKGALKKCDIW